MIYTRYGTKVTITDAEEGEDGIMWIKVTTEDGRDREWNLIEFKADGGFNEIVGAIRDVVPPERFRALFPNP